MDYDKFMNKPVRVITTGRKKHFEVTESLQLEGILERETTTQIYLKNMSEYLTTTTPSTKPQIEAAYAAISKAEIIALYLNVETESIGHNTP